MEGDQIPRVFQRAVINMSKKAICIASGHKRALFSYGEFTGLNEI